MKLFIIAGHGGSKPYDPGAMGNGYKEAELVRKLATKIKQYGGDKVIIGDMTKNWYADGLIGTYKFEKDTQILELHMDCADSKTAHGGHIIVDADLTPNKYDVKLADMISKFFPGRSEKISKRNLGNSNRAQKRNIPYRLGEFGFISYADDVNKFISKMDELAINILQCFDISVDKKTEPVKNETKTEVKPTPVVTKPAAEEKSQNKLFKVTTDKLRIRKGPGTNYPLHVKNGAEVWTGAGIFTIVEIKSGSGSKKGWGLLKSYADKKDGWISLDFADEME